MEFTNSYKKVIKRSISSRKKFRQLCSFNARPLSIGYVTLCMNYKLSSCEQPLYHLLAASHSPIISMPPPHESLTSSLTFSFCRRINTKLCFARCLGGNNYWAALNVLNRREGAMTRKCVKEQLIKYKCATRREQNFKQFSGARLRRKTERREASEESRARRIEEALVHHLKFFIFASTALVSEHGDQIKNKWREDVEIF